MSTVRPDSLEDVMLVTTGALTLLSSKIRDRGRQGADYRRAAGDLIAEGPARIQDGSFAAGVADVFRLASRSGVTELSWLRLRESFAGLSAFTETGKRVRRDFLVLSLIEETEATLSIEYQSVDQTDAARTHLSGAFDDMILAVSDQGDGDVAAALTRLLGAAVQDLNRRGRTLPRVVEYHQNARMPALYLAQRYYGDASRAGDIIAMNSTKHPAFMPADGAVLSQ